MSGRSAIPVFVDTGAFYARADTDDEHHDEAKQLFDSIRASESVYRPIYTSQAVLSEFATLALYKLGHEVATGALTAIRESSSINVLPVDEPTFATTAEQFADYDDQRISFVDHTTSILADERDIDHVITFDSDFRTLGFTLLPADENVPDG